MLSACVNVCLCSVLPVRQRRVQPETLWRADEILRGYGGNDDDDLCNIYLFVCVLILECKVYIDQAKLPAIMRQNAHAASDDARLLKRCNVCGVSMHTLETHTAI